METTDTKNNAGAETAAPVISEVKKWSPRNMQRWQKKRLIGSFLMVVIIGISFLGITLTSLYSDKISEDDDWVSVMQTDPATQKRVKELSGEETKVLCGTYIENLKQISLKNSNYSVEFLVWFRWEGDKIKDMTNNFRVYKGSITENDLVRNYYKNGVHYQQFRCDATVSKNFWTRRFPLESHQLRFYIEANPTVKELVFVADDKNSGVNPSMGISGYKLMRNTVGVVNYEYLNTQSDPVIGKAPVHSELVTALEINRSTWGLYVKCFIALFGTTTWVLITLFLNTYHKVDPLGMIPAALFGTVSNIMVGANLLPDALQLGLIEYVNIWGVMIILAVTFAIININRIRSKYEDKEFAVFYGRIMFYTILTLTVVGNVSLPLTAFRF
ncbi:MAG: hypothetical protein RR115_02510 [Hydrogenoanaerobacterium sp.]